MFFSQHTPKRCARTFFFISALLVQLALLHAQPSFQIGTIFEEGVDLDTHIQTPGYPTDLAWAYEQLPDRESANKLGLNIFGIVPDHAWRRRFRPDRIPRRNRPALNRPIQSGLPLIADFTIHSGTPAWMELMEGVRPVESAWTQNPISGIPYNVATPDGQELWATIWKDSLNYFSKEQIPASSYYLFSNADYFDTSYRVKIAFRKKLLLQHKSLANINKALGTKIHSTSQLSNFKKSTENICIHVEFTKFLEDSFASTFSNAVSIISAETHNQSPSVFFQPASDINKGIDPEKVAPFQTCIAAPAKGESPLVNAMYTLALADGKPTINATLPLSGNAQDVRNTILAQFARGYNTVLLSKWKRNARAWIKYTRKVPDNGGRPKTVQDESATIQAGQAYAHVNPTEFMNPFALAPLSLSGIRQAADDIKKAEPLFAYSNRIAKTSIALLKSRTSERLIGTKFDTYGSNTLAVCTHALLHSGFKADLVTEMLLSDTNRLERYHAIIIPDTAYASRPEILDKLLNYVQRGNILILTQSALSVNQHGSQFTGDNILLNTKDMKLQSEIVFDTKTWVRPYGKGQIIKFDKTTNQETTRKILEHILQRHSVANTWQCLDPATGKVYLGIEVSHAVTPDGIHGLILFNRTGVTKSIRVEIPSIKSPIATDLISGKTFKTAENYFEIELKSDNGEIISIVENPAASHEIKL